MTHIDSPVSRAGTLRTVSSSDEVSLSGEMITMRDMSLAELKKRPSAVNLAGAAVYFCAPTSFARRPRRPEKPRRLSCGPTTSARMAAGIGFLAGRGAKIFVGKGPLPAAAAAVLRRRRCLYLVAVGGCGAYYSKFVEGIRVAAFDNLGPEAILKMRVKNMPLIVANDTFGGDAFNAARKYARNTGYRKQ